MDDEIHTRIDFLEDMLNFTPDTSTPSLLNWDQVLEMVNCGIVDVGSHTCNHIRLNKLTDANVMKYEIIDSKRHIEKITGKRVSAFCFPNGDYNEQCLNMVKQHYLCALTTKRGVNSSDTDVYQLKRISLHEDSTNNKVSFLASISGLL